MISRTLYGWFDPVAKTYRLSLEPPDAPTRPIFAQSPIRSAIEDYAAKKRGRILWLPPLKNQKTLSL